MICRYATKFVWLSVFTLTETICPKSCSKSRIKNAKSALPVDVRRSKTSLLKLPSNNRGRQRRRQQDRPKSRSEKPKTLHVHNAFSYISLLSRHDCGVKLRGRELFTRYRNYFHSRASSCHLHICLCMCSHDTEKKFCSRTGHSGMTSFRFSFWSETHSGII